jgi:uncharacterized membrane protein YeaQ/YmgE (transglycosylase-associated protein family)
MGILMTIVVGFIVGVVAKLIYPGRQNMGLIVTTLLGIGGALLAGFLGQALGIYMVGQAAGFIASVIGALIVLFIYTRVRRA